MIESAQEAWGGRKPQKRKEWITEEIMVKLGRRNALMSDTSEDGKYNIEHLRFR